MSSTSRSPLRRLVEALDRVVEHGADRDQQLAQRVGELARELGRELAAQAVDEPEQRAQVREGRSAAAPRRSLQPLGGTSRAASLAASSARCCASRTSRSAAS